MPIETVGFTCNGAVVYCKRVENIFSTETPRRIVALVQRTHKTSGEVVIGSQTSSTPLGTKIVVRTVG